MVSSLVRSLVRSFVRSSALSLVRSFVRSFIRSFVRSFVCVENTVPLCNVQDKNTDSVRVMRVQDDVIGNLC